MATQYYHNMLFRVILDCHARSSLAMTATVPYYSPRQLPHNEFLATTTVVGYNKSQIINNLAEILEDFRDLAHTIDGMEVAFGFVIG